MKPVTPVIRNGGKKKLPNLRSENSKHHQLLTEDSLFKPIDNASKYVKPKLFLYSYLIFDNYYIC